MRPDEGQPIIDKAWNEMAQFVREHPTSQHLLPKKEILTDFDLGRILLLP